MKDTIRLTKRNKDRLSSYHDNGNRAIEAVIDCLDTLQLKVDTYESMNRSQHNAPIYKSPETFSSVSQTGSCTGFMPASKFTDTQPYPQPDYWKKFDDHIEKAFEKARGY